jgi:hypothetical protein
MSVGPLCLIAIFFFAVGPSPVFAVEEAVWPVKGKLVGKDGGKSEDISGIACSTSQGFPRSCLVIDDNIQEAQAVTLKDGEIVVGETIRLIENTHKGKPLDLDGEGVAYADGFYYVIGSHGRPRKSNEAQLSAKTKAKIAASSQIVRVQVEPGTGATSVERTDKLRPILASDTSLSSFLDRRLDKNGLTIEGVAVSGGRLFAGFRGPTLEGGRAAVLSVAVDYLFGQSAPDARLHRIPLGDGQGIRDLVHFDDGFLVLAGPTADGPGTYGIFWWDGHTEAVKFLKDLAVVTGKKGTRKAEALLPLDRTSSTVRLLILFDGEKEGAPVTIMVPSP